MRRAAGYFVGFLLGALSCCASYGQNCGLAMQSRYSDYVSVSVSGNTIYTTVQVSGYTQVQIEPGCTLNGVTHQGKVDNTISTAGGWDYGPSVWPPDSIDVTNNQTFTGTPGATYPFNWVAEVDCSMIGVFFHDSGTSQIPVVSASISQRNTSTVSSDDAALPNYQTTEGTKNLGPIIGSGTAKGCFIGIETIGTIAPSTYTGNVILHRTIGSNATYTNSTSTGGLPAGTDDTSDPHLRLITHSLVILWGKCMTSMLRERSRQTWTGRRIGSEPITMHMLPSRTTQ